MSIETQLEKLNSNLLRLTEALEDLKGNAPVQAEPEPEAEPAPAPKKKTTRKKAPTRKKKTTRKKAPAKRARVNYDDDVKPMVLAAIATPEGREEVKELLAEFGVKKAPDLDESDYPDFIKQVTEIVERHEDE